MPDSLADYLISHEVTITNGSYVAALLVISAWEGISQQRRKLTSPMGLRWAGNIIIAILDSVLVRSIFPLIGIAFAMYVSERGWGLFQLIDLPLIATSVLAVIIFDFSRYVLHVGFHRVPLLWRCHIVHHTDLDYDFSTSLRFHPFEAIITAIYKMIIIALLGAPVAVVLIYEVLSNMLGVFVHANFRVPLGVDRWLRKVIVTPDVHRVHHSARAGETNSNYSGVFLWWDYLFGTYIDQPYYGHEKMTIGLPEYQDPKHLTLKWMLMQPFLTNTTPQAVGEVLTGKSSMDEA